MDSSGQLKIVSYAGVGCISHSNGYVGNTPEVTVMTRGWRKSGALHANDALKFDLIYS